MPPFSKSSRAFAVSSISATRPGNPDALARRGAQSAGCAVSSGGGRRKRRWEGRPGQRRGQKVSGFVRKASLGGKTGARTFRTLVRRGRTIVRNGRTFFIHENEGGGVGKQWCGGGGQLCGTGEQLCGSSGQLFGKSGQLCAGVAGLVGVENNCPPGANKCAECPRRCFFRADNCPLAGDHCAERADICPPRGNNCPAAADIIFPLKRERPGGAGGRAPGRYRRPPGGNGCQTVPPGGVRGAGVMPLAVMAALLEEMNSRNRSIAPRTEARSGRSEVPLRGPGERAQVCAGICCRRWRRSRRRFCGRWICLFMKPDLTAGKAGAGRRWRRCCAGRCRWCRGAGDIPWSIWCRMGRAGFCAGTARSFRSMRGCCRTMRRGDST